MFSAISLLLTVAATPTPVTVQNWPGPDTVALDTLKYARWAFWATVVIGIPTLVFGVVDYALNMRQFRRPKLSVSLRGGSRDARPLVRTKRDDGTQYTFDLPLQLNNDGTRGATGCYVAVWLPRPLDWQGMSAGWTYGGDLLEPTGIVQYQRVETYVAVPAYVDHPIFLPALTIFSPKGATEFHVRWQVFDESCKSPSGAPGFIYTGVD